MTERFSIGLISDLQYGEIPAFKLRHYDQSIKKLLKIIKSLNRLHIDLTINLGDTIENDFNHFDKIKDTLKHLRCPIYHLAGNHDFEIEPQWKIEVNNQLSIPEPGYYSFVHKGWKFVMLDGNEISLFAHEPDTEKYQLAQKLIEDGQAKKRINAKVYNGGISDTQLIWLQQELAGSQEEGNNVAIFCHYPVYPANKHNLLNNDKVLECVLDFNCVKAWFNGHNHDGNYGLHKGIHFINLTGAVETEQTITFSLAHFSKSRLVIEGFGRDQSYILEV